MPAEKMDKRVRRTQEALRSALLELIVERSYEKLSVQHILDRASVGRATFYLHYRSKEDLLRRSLDQLREHLIQECQSASKSKAPSKSPLGFSLAFFRHVDSHRRLYRAIVGRESGAIVDRQMRRLLADLVKEVVPTGQRERSGIKAEMVAQYVAGALMSIVTWWLDRNIKLSSAEIDSAFLQMTVPALQASGHL
jgi:AcrR family transcriptional regulator